MSKFNACALALLVMTLASSVLLSLLGPLGVIPFVDPNMSEEYVRVAKALARIVVWYWLGCLVLWMVINSMYLVRQTLDGRLFVRDKFAAFARRRYASLVISSLLGAVLYWIVGTEVIDAERLVGLPWSGVRAGATMWAVYAFWLCTVLTVVYAEVRISRIKREMAKVTDNTV